MSDLNEDDSKILRILGLSRDELTAILAVFAIILFAIFYFRGCSTLETPLGELDGAAISADVATDAAEGDIEITDVRVAYRPNFVHFDGTGADSEDVEIYLNGNNVRETQTTLSGKWSAEVADLEPGFYEVYAVHPDLDDSESKMMVFQVLADADEGQSVRMFPAGTTLAAATAGTALVDGAVDIDGDIGTSGLSLLKPTFNPELALTGLTAGAITLNGTGSPNVRHLLYVDGEEVNSTTADADGNWSFVYNQPNAGDYDLSVVAVADEDTRSSSDTLALGLAAVAVADAVDPEPVPTVEAAPTDEPEQEPTAEPEEVDAAVEEAEPTAVPALDYLVTLADPVTGATNFDTVSLSGEATAGTIMGLFIDGVLVHSAPVGPDGSWSFDGIFPPGPHDISVQIFEDDSMGQALQTTSGQIEIAAATDIILANSGRNGLVKVNFADADAGNGNTGVGIAGEAPAVELIVDASWSMTLPLNSNEEADRLTAADPNSRISVAQTALIDLVQNTLPEGAPVALRAFGNIEGNLACRTDLMSELQPLNRETLVNTITGIQPQFDANTALGASLAQVRNDLANTDREKVVVLLTDGKETCGRDPGIVIDTLAAEGTQVQVNIIGFAIQDDQLKAEFVDWADRGNGQYYDALDADRLASALAETMTVGYLVTDLDGNMVQRGVVNGQALSLEPGIYNITNSNGDVIYQNIVVTSSSVNELIAR